MQDSWLERGAWIAMIIVGFVALKRLMKKDCGCHGKRQPAAMAPTPQSTVGPSTCGFGGKGSM